MSTEKIMSIKEIDEHIEQSEQNVSGINICGTYNTVRPVLVFAKSVLGIVKPKWATVLGVFISTVDAFCTQPSTNTTTSAE